MSLNLVEDRHFLPSCVGDVEHELFALREYNLLDSVSRPLISLVVMFAISLPKHKPLSCHTHSSFHSPTKRHDECRF